MRPLSRIRWRYYAYRVTTSLGFYVPVSVLYILDAGYGVQFVALMQAVFSVTVLLAEVPAGYLGDRIGPRLTLAIGSALRVAGLVGYVLVDVAAGYLLLKVLFGLGWAFRSGTKDAWLYELLAVRDEADRFAHVESRGSTALLLTSALGAVTGGVLYGVDAGLPFLVNAALTGLGLPVLASMPAVEGRDEAAESPVEESNPLTVREALRTIRLQGRRPEVRWMVLYTVLVFLVFDLSRTFEQPALDALGVPATGLGVLYAGFKLVSAGAASSVGWIQDTLGTRRALALAVPVLGGAYAAIAVAPVAVVPVLFLYRGARVVLRPIRNQYLNDRLGNLARATVLSSVSMTLSLAGVVARLVGGEIAAVTGPLAFLSAAGVGLTLFAGGVWVVLSPVRLSETNASGRRGDSLVAE